MKLFPKHVSTIAAWTETLFSFGYMLGNFAQKFSIQKSYLKIISTHNAIHKTQLGMRKIEALVQG